MMTLNNVNPFKVTAKTFSSSPYLKFTILLYKYRLPYLPTYHKFFCPNFFFWKKFGSKIPYLPTVWTYVQSFVVFLFGTLSLESAPHWHFKFSLANFGSIYQSIYFWSTKMFLSIWNTFLVPEPKKWNNNVK